MSNKTTQSRLEHIMSASQHWVPVSSLNLFYFQFSENVLFQSFCAKTPGHAELRLLTEHLDVVCKPLFLLPVLRTSPQKRPKIPHAPPSLLPLHALSFQNKSRSKPSTPEPPLHCPSPRTPTVPAPSPLRCRSDEASGAAEPLGALAQML